MRGGKRTTQRAKELRHSMTDAERFLWEGLRGGRLGWRFRRQHPIPPFIVDFACLEGLLVVEADGGQHAQPGEHAHRDAELRRRGWQVLRFWNHEILADGDAVLLAISAALGPLCPENLPKLIGGRL
ncbi:MAG: endonuclease domain-containing protein [Caulobacteraceae bacterium]|nr:endonuclease domain-containing protein [Caulobacteraceae bacterium]